MYPVVVWLHIRLFVYARSHTRLISSFQRFIGNGIHLLSHFQVRENEQKMPQIRELEVSALQAANRGDFAKHRVDEAEILGLEQDSGV